MVKYEGLIGEAVILILFPILIIEQSTIPLKKANMIITTNLAIKEEQKKD